jgi:hypothetical protein
MARIDITVADQVGWVPDQPPQILPPAAWTDCLNVRFIDGAVERVKGYFEGYGSPIGFARCIQQVRKQDGTFAWVYAHDAGLGMVVGEINTSLDKAATTYSLLDREKPSLIRFNDRVVTNYPSLAPQYLWPIDELSDFADLPFWPAALRTKRMVVFKEYLFALGIKNNTNPWEYSTILWSHTAEPDNLPDSWDITNPAKDAGAFQLGESADRIIDAVQMGGTLYIYKENSVYACVYGGYPQIFNFSRVFADRGCLSPDCVVDVGGEHLVVDRGDIYTHNGATAKSILTGRARRWWRSVVDKTYGWKTFAKVYPYQKEVWICFPTDGNVDCNEVLVWNYETNKLSRRTFKRITAIGVGYLDITDNISWDAFSGMWVTNIEAWSTTVDNWNSEANPEQWLDIMSSWDTILGDRNVDHFLMCVEAELVANDPRFGFCDSTGRFGGANFYAYVERTGLAYEGIGKERAPYANVHSMKLLREVWPRVESDGPIMVQVGSQVDADTAVYWEAPVPFQPGVDKKVDCFISGKLLAVRFFSTEKGYWRLAGYELEIEKMGTY